MIGIFFFAIPILILLEALATQFTREVLEVDKQSSVQTVANGEEPKETEPLAIIKTWIFISVSAQILFAVLTLTPLVKKLKE